MAPRARILPLAVVVAVAMLSPRGTAAADPTLGGSLGANAEVVIVDSTANVPVLVELSAPEGWRIENASFRLDPGGRHESAILEIGEAGQIVATMTALEVPTGTDRTALVLAVGLPKPAAVPWYLLIFPLALVAGGLLVRRFRWTRR